MRTGFILAVILGSATPALSSITSFVETFPADSANWRNFNGSGMLDWFPSGGPDGSSYASGSFNLLNATGGFPPVVIRAQANFNSSGNAFVGDWLSQGVTGVSFDIRHDLPESITITGRFATPMNFPGASTESAIAVAPNTWTTIFFDLTEGSSDIISLGGGTYAGIFSSIGNIQLGFNVPAGLGGQDINARFDIDNFAIVPTPASIALLAMGGFTVARRRR